MRPRTGSRSSQALMRHAWLRWDIPSAAARRLTRNHQVGALVLLSTYASIKDMGHRYGLPGFLVRFPWDNVARIWGYDGPVFIEHGRRDGVIPFALGGQRLSTARPDARFVALDCGHDDCAFDRSLFDGPLTDWLAQALNGNAAPSRSK